MMKYGNKILAILLTAVCLIGVLPLIVYAKTESIYIPPTAALVHGKRYSKSSAGYIEDKVDSLIIPLPAGVSSVTITGLSEAPLTTKAAYYLNAEYQYVADLPISGRVDIEVNNAVGASYVSICYEQGAPRPEDLLINGESCRLIVGDHTNAKHGYYEQIEIPETPTEGDIANNVLQLWQRILNENIVLINGFYKVLARPIGLLMAIPCCIALIGILFSLIGGKKR